MNNFNAADWSIIIVYLLGMIVLGFWFGKDQKNTKDYFLGSKNIPWWGVGFSIVATETSALTFIGVPAMAFGADALTFIQIVIGYVIARIILAIVLVPHYFKGEIYSPYQLFSQAFGQSARRTAGAFFLLAATLAAGVRVYVTCIPIRLMLGFNESQIIWAIILFVSLSLVYTYVGGVKAVIWTEAIQFFLFLAGGLFTLFYVPSLLEGGISTAFETAREAGKLHWLNLDFSLSKPYNIWMGIIGGTVFVMSTHGADQLIVQRVLTCKSVKEGRKALILSAVIIFPLFLIFLLAGVMLWVFYQQMPMPDILKNDEIFPRFIIDYVPNILKGCLIVAVLSAAMSSVAAALSALASVSTMDFVKALARKERSDEFYLRFSKYSTAFWALILIFLAYLSKEVKSVLEAAFSLHGLTSGAMLGGLLLAVFWKKGRSTPVVTGMIASLIGMTFIHINYKGVIEWPWYTLIGTIITIVIAYIVRAIFGGERPATIESSKTEAPTSLPK